MLIKKDREAKIRIYYKKIGNSGHNYYAFSSTNFAKLKASVENEKVTKQSKAKEGLMTKEDLEKFEQLNLVMKEVNWGINNELQEAAFVDSVLPNGEVDRQFNYKRFKEAKLVRLLKEWDIEDEDGNPVPVTEENIFQLPTEIAETILNTYEDSNYLTEDAEKN